MKCRICKEEIKPKDTEVVLLKKASYCHKQCYIDKETKMYSEETVRHYAEEAQQRYLEQKKKKEEEHLSGLNKAIYNKRDNFVKWIYNSYDISIIPHTWYMKMNELEKGKAKEVSEPISSEDLLEMFKIKRQKLEQMTSKIQFKSNYSKFLYHFKVILGQYNSYKNCKEKIKMQNENNKQEYIDTNITKSLVRAKITNKQEEIDFSEEGDYQ